MKKQSPSGGEARGRNRFSVRVLSLATGLLAMSGFAAGIAAQPASAASPNVATGLAYTPLASPVRIVDTRPGANDPATYAGRTLASGASIVIDIPGVPSNTGAVVGQLTAIAPTLPGYLNASPTGTGSSGTANVLFTGNQTVGNLVTVGTGTDSSTGAPSVTITNGPSGNTNFAFDLYGYYAPQTASSGDAYVPLTPARIEDTRIQGGTLGAGSILTVPTAGAGGIPANANAAVLNVAVTNTTASSYIQCYGTGSPPSGATPTVNQNWVAGETLSTQVIVPIGSGGSVTCKNAAGSTDLVVDADGYMTAPGTSTGGSFLFPLSTPIRLDDTRPSAIPAGFVLDVAVAGTNGVPSNATAGVLNLTDIAQGPNYMTFYPNGAAVPLAANVNYTQFDTSSTLSNASYATVGTGGIVELFNSTSPANAVVDMDGYFAPASTPVTTGSVTAITPTSGPVGTVVTPTVQNPSGVTSLSVSGCGLTNQALSASSTPAYSFTIPTGQSPGTCELVFTATGTSGTVTTDPAFTITGSTTGGTGTVTAINPTSGPAGSNVVATVTNPNAVTAEAVSGCGLTNQNVTKSGPTSTFSFQIPSTTATGPCTLTFVSNNNDGSPSQTSTATFTVTAGPAQTSPLTTSAPDLVSASVLVNGNGTTTPSVVQYLFDKPVTCAPAAGGPPGAFANFELMTANTGANTNTQGNFANNCTGTPGNTDGVNVTFPPAAIALSYPLAVVQNTPAGEAPGSGAVTGTQPGNGNGLPNPLGAVALNGSTAPGGTTPGLTASPQLMSVTPINSSTAVFTFNQGIAACNNVGTGAGGATFSGFQFWQISGAPTFDAGVGTTTAGTCIATGNPQVTVTFGTGGTGPFGESAGAGLVTSAARFGVLPGAVTAASNPSRNPSGAVPGPQGSLGGSNTEGWTGAPLLTTVAQTANPNVYNYTFDTGVSGSTANLGAGDFELYAANYSAGVAPAAALGATLFTGTAAIQNGPDTIAVTFAIPSNQQGNITLGAYEYQGCAQGLGGAFCPAADATNAITTNTGSEPITLITGSNVGATFGPDLVSVAVSGPNTIQYTFDKAFAAAPASADFFVIPSSGIANFGVGATALTNGGTTVTVTFASAAVVTGGQGAGVVDALAAENGVAANAGTGLSGGFPNAPGDLTLG
ncbi:MAG TPA: hypothetical protein VMR97_08675 [Acidimicrobiales bacterium]|nr:hypothetical protein [Acidimicrobiales bacterium]